LTGDLDEKAIQAGLTSGMDMVLSKPIRKNQIQKLLKEKGLV
jgi:CheY-like chemotaxis protein